MLGVGSVGAARSVAPVLSRFFSNSSSIARRIPVQAMLPFNTGTPSVSSLASMAARGFSSQQLRLGSIVPSVIARHSLEFPIPETLKPGDTVLVANRGSSAARFIRTAHGMGIKTVQVVAKGDTPFDLADRVVELKESDASAYLKISDLVKIAKTHNVKHVWPGWGFWSESTPAHTEFRTNGIYVLGPEPKVVANLGDKTTAREIAIKVGAPVVPGTEVLNSLEDATAEASKMGYPVLVKAVSGGGGKGMRVAHSEAELVGAFSGAKTEAKASFGDDRVFLEKFVNTKIKHIEVQILGDLHGNVRHLGTRHCSVQRRNQKVLEEAPAPTEYHYLAEIAVRIVKEAGYSGAGTVEFIVDEEGDAYFMEVNTRLQVEHPITEQIHTGLDLVKAQIQVAMGQPLSVILEGVSRRDVHAIETRLIKETLMPVNGVWNTFPVPGVFSRAAWPVGINIRVEGNTRTPSISDGFDSNFGAVIATGATRNEAIRTIQRGLMEGYFGGSKDTNSSFLHAILSQPDFADPKKIHIKWLEAQMATAEFQIQVHDPKNPINFQAQLDLLGTYVAEASVNGSVISGGVNAVPKDLAPALPVPEFPVTPTWPLFGKFFTDAGGGVPGSVAVVAAWKAAAAKGQMLLGNTRYRDLGQTAIANRDGEHEKQMSASYMDQLPWAWLEIGGGANTHSDLKFKLQDPIETTSTLKKLLPNQVTSGLARDIAVVAYGDTPLDDEAVSEIYKTLSVDGGIQKLRIFQGMNDIGRLKKAVLAAASTGAILDISMVFHKRYTSEDYAKFLGEMFRFAKEHEFSDRVIFTIKDAQGMIGMEELHKMKDVPRLLDLACGEPQLIGFHSHDAMGVTAAVVAKSAEYGFRHGDVANEKLVTTNTQPAVSQVVQLLKGTPHDTHFPLEHLDPLADHDRSVRRLWAPLMPENEITSSQVQTYGLPPGMINNVRQQYISAGGKPTEFRRFLEIYGMVLTDITGTTGVTPYSKDAGEIALWVLLSDSAGKIKTLVDIAKFIVANAAKAPNSTKNLFRGEKGVAQFEFHPEVEAAFKALSADQVPQMKAPSGDYQSRITARTQALEVKYSRRIPRYLAVLEDMFPGDVEALLQHEQKFGIYTGTLPLQIKLRGLQVGEALTLPDVAGKLVRFKLLHQSEPDAKGVRQVMMSIQDRVVTIGVTDKKAVAARGTSALSVKIVESPGPGDVVAPMPGKMIALKITDGATVEKGTPVAVLEVMKMQTILTADKSGKVSFVGCSEGMTVVAGQLIMEIN